MRCQHFASGRRALLTAGQDKEALATVRQLVDLDPENIATRIKLAELYSKEAMNAEAVTEFQVACDQLRKQNRVDDFVKVAERLLWHKADNLPLNRELAVLYLRRNDPRRALQKLQTCFKADPRDVETLALLAQASGARQKSKTVSGSRSSPGSSREKAEGQGEEVTARSSPSCRAIRLVAYLATGAQARGRRAQARRADDAAALARVGPSADRSPGGKLGRST